MTPRDPRWPSDVTPEAEDPAPDVSSLALRRAPRRRPSLRTMETVLLASAAALLAAVAWPMAQASWASEPSPPVQVPTVASMRALDTEAPPKIQLALLLDTSSSMDGLIDQARTQLWAVVNALDSATFQGAAPQLEIAVYEYGNDRLPSEGGYIRRVVPLTSELDVVSEGLFGLSTAGGDEYAGQAIGRAVNELEWSSDPHTLKVLYIAGNEGFSQGPVDFRETIAGAKAQGIVVNTVNCTGHHGWEEGWLEAAELGGGRALLIDQSAKQAYVPSPHDEAIETLSTELNGTYLGYGARGVAAASNQARQDLNSASVGRASSIARAQSKTSRLYDNAGWDLVDATDQGVIDLAEIDRSTLSDDLAKLDDGALAQRVETARSERERIQKELRSLQAKRDAYVAEHADDGGERLDNAIIESITTQATAAGFKL